MILQALLQKYDRSLRSDPRTPTFGFGFAPISFAIVLAEDGTVADVHDLRSVEGKSVRARELLVPKDFEDRTSGDSAPRALWDNAEWVLGVGSDVKRAERRSTNFRERQSTLLEHVDDRATKALLAFLRRWNKADIKKLRYGDELSEKTNIVFRLDGAPSFVHDSVPVQSAWRAAVALRTAMSGQCLVTGETSGFARIHPLIKNIARPGQPTPKLVAFDKDSDAFDSFGKKQGANAPVSERAAFAYTTVLNDLLSRDSKQKVQIGDTTTVFWAEADDAAVADQAEQAFAWLLTPSSPADADARETTLLKSHMDAFAKGRPLPNPALKLDPATRFYILGLSPNAARLSVRFWEMTTLGELGAAFHQHWQDLRIDTPPARGTPPSIPALTLRTAPARRDRQDNIKFSFDDVSPLLSGELMRAILTGNRYPGALLSNLVMRVRTDGVLDRIRVSLIKATIMRAMRLEQRLPKEDYLVRTDPNDPNTARRLGRLFAVLERAQLAALGDNINTTIKDKFLGAAAATPGQVFVGLIKNAQHHTKRLRNGHADAGWIKDSNHARRVGFGLERDIGSLWGSFNEGLPPQQSIEEQGLFFVGYYQERFAGKPDQQVGEEPGIDTPDINDDQE